MRQHDVSGLKMRSYSFPRASTVIVVSLVFGSVALACNNSAEQTVEQCALVDAGVRTAITMAERPDAAMVTPEAMSGAATVTATAIDRLDLSLTNGVDVTIYGPIGWTSGLDLGLTLQLEVEVWNHFSGEGAGVLRTGAGELILAFWNVSSEEHILGSVDSLRLRYEEGDCPSTEVPCGDVIPQILFVAAGGGERPVRAGEVLDMSGYRIINGGGSLRYLQRIQCSEIGGLSYQGTVLKL